MASSSGAVVLVALGLVAVGLAADADGDPEPDGSRDADESEDFDVGDGSACDGVVVVERASGTAEVPGGDTWSDSSVDCDMGEGQGDEDAVRALQDALVTCNGQDISVDGEYGEQTRQAVARVEEQTGLPVDGAFDPGTRDAMRWPETSASGTTTCVSDVDSSSDSADGP